MSLTADKKSWKINSKIIGLRILLVTITMAIAMFCQQSIFACEVTDVDVWVGDDDFAAEVGNTTDVWKCPGDDFGWYAEWTAETPDDNDFDIRIALVTTEVDSSVSDPVDRDQSGTATIPAGFAVGTHTVYAKVRRVDSEWEVGTATAKINISEVEEIESGDVTSSTDSPGSAETLYVAKGSPAETITITATPNPSGSWPSGEPTWTNATSSGASTATFPIDTVSASSAGTTVTATCCSSSVSMKIVVVEVDEIQYDDPATSWTTAGTLYVYLGTTVDFKAIPDPSGASWPSGKPVWGGTSGASGTGSTTSVTFNTLSSSSTDYKTVTAECGNTETVNVVVYHFSLDIDEEDDFTGRSHTKLGIEEEVELKYFMTPSSVTASQAGGLEWTRSGLGTISNAGTDGIADYDAEETPGGTPGDVILTLTVVSGPSAGEHQWSAREIVAPTGTRMTRYSANCKHRQNFASAGIALWYWLDPKEVSFSNLTFGEDSCASIVTGFYTQCAPWNSYPTGTAQPGHAQNTFGAINGGNSTTGCRVNLKDGAQSGEANPYAAGTLTWVIPTQYIDDTATRNTFGSNQTHVSTYQANGDATQSKGGESDSATLGSVTVGW